MIMKKTNIINKSSQKESNGKDLSKKNSKRADIYYMSTPDFIKNVNSTSKGFNFVHNWARLVENLFKRSIKEINSLNDFSDLQALNENGNSMLSEIKEQPKIIKELVEKYLPLDLPVQNVCLNLTKEEIGNISKIYIVASGSSRNVGSISKYIIEYVAKIPVEVDYSSEFAHKNPFLTNENLVIAISQSGETADTFCALKVAREKGAHTLALTNNPESRISHLAESHMQVGAGKEKSIAATKSVTAQLINLYALAVYFGEQKGILSKKEINNLKQELHLAEDKLEKIFENVKVIDKIAEKIKNSKSIVLLGRSLNFAVAKEGALKIKETSYIDANGYPTGEFLHGHMAVVDKDIPVISIIVPNKKNPPNYKLALSNTEEIKQKRSPHLIIIKSQADKEIEKNPVFKNTDFINIPETCEEVSPLFVVIVLQLLALKIAQGLGRDVDNPRSLTKAIVSE